MENVCRAAYFRVNVSTACARFSDLARLALSQSLPPVWKKASSIAAASSQRWACAKLL